jgi:hypothetical protein
MTNLQIETWEDTLIAAKRRARENGNGYAFACAWPAGHFTVEDRKPSLRLPGMRVMDCDASGREVLA